MTSQRHADVLKVKKADIQDGVIGVTQEMTGNKLGITITPHLDAILKRWKGTASFLYSQR